MIGNVLIASFIALAFGYTMSNLDGPFGLSERIRFWLMQETRPAWMINGAQCVFCWCFWGGLLGAVLIFDSHFLVIWFGGVGLAYAVLLYTGFGHEL